jgi:transglutaminase-like putative cysteine protease
MSLERYFIFSSYAMFTTGFVMLAATRQLDGLSLALYAVALGAGWLIDTDRLRRSVSSRRANHLMVGYLFFALAEWWLLGASPVIVILHFVFFASSLKLLRKKTGRDWLWLYVVTFCQALMTAGMMVDAGFLFLIVVYLFAAVSAFVSYEIHRSAQAFAGAHSQQRIVVEYWKESKGSRQVLKTPRLRPLAVFSAFALIVILLLAAPLFLAMPRVSRSYSRNGLLRTEMLSGFSDSVRLGEVAQVKLNPQVVMRVRVRFAPGREGRMLRWRGVTLDYYDGQSWNYTGPKPAFVKRSGDSFHLSENVWTYNYTEQRFFLEPLNINTVFAAPHPLLVAGLPALARDQGDRLWTEPHDFHKLEYTVFSDTGEVADVELAEDDSRAYPSELQRRYTQLPPDHDRRIDQLAVEITRGATTEVEIARRIEGHLRSAYSYTLDLQRVEDGDPVADFLFNTRAGHCEYFASAMTLMLRSRRVPARLVNGFQMGEYNDAADVYTVRQSDAHSWVEVFFPKHGWVAFDPTPAAGLSVYGDGIAARLRRWREAMEMFWLEHVIGFDTSKQLSMAFAAQAWFSSLFSSYRFDVSSRWFDWVSRLAQRVESWKERRRGFDGKFFESGQPSGSMLGLFSHPLTLALFGLTLTGVVAMFWRRRSQSWQRKARQSGAASAIAFYQEMLRTLERAGHKRAADQTPAEFAAELRMPAVTEITNLYQQVRFGDQSLDDHEITRVGVLLGELKKQPGESRLSRISFRSN